MINFPITASLPADKLEFLYSAIEKLRLEHNSNGKDYREGKIDRSVWEDYLDKTFNPKNRILHLEAMKLRYKEESDGKVQVLYDLIPEEKNNFKQSVKYTIDLTEIK